MKKISYLFLVLAWLMAINSFGQDVEELKEQLTKTKPDTIQLQLLSDLHWALAYSNKLEAKKYASMELDLALRLKSKKWEAQAYNDLGISEQLEYNRRQALELHKKALKIRTDLKDEVGMASSLLKVGMIYIELDELDKGLQMEQKALILLRKTGNKQGIAYALSNICSVLEEKKQYGKMGEYASQAYAICRETGDEMGMGNASNHWAMWLENNKKYQKAEEKYKQSLSHYQAISDTVGTTAVLNNLGHLNQQLNPKLVIYYYKKALDLALKYSSPDTNSLVTYMANTANQYNIQKKFGPAEGLLRNALLMSQQAGQTRILSQIYSNLSDIFTQTGQADSAIKYAEYFQMAVEQKFSTEMAENFSKLQTQFEIDLREQQKATLAKENELKSQKLIQYQIILGAVILIFCLLGVVFWLYRNRQKIIRKRQLAEEQWKQQEARSKAVIEAEERERQRIARELHDGIGQQLSAARLHLSALEGSLETNQTKEEALLSNAMSMMDDAIREVRTVAHSMLANALLKQGLAGAVRDFIQKINSSGQIRIELEISGLDKNIEPMVESMLFRIIQELMSNIIRHAKANEVSIQLHRHETELILMVEDNGVGFDPTNQTTGAGMENISSRVNFIKGHLEIDSFPGRGTTVSIEVPILA